MGTNQMQEIFRIRFDFKFCQMVIDADAINIIAEHPKLKEILQKHHNYIKKNLKDGWIMENRTRKS